VCGVCGVCVCLCGVCVCGVCGVCVADGPIIVRCTSSQVKNCLAVSTTGLSDKR